MLLNPILILLLTTFTVAAPPKTRKAGVTVTVTATVLLTPTPMPAPTASLDPEVVWCTSHQYYCQHCSLDDWGCIENPNCENCYSKSLFTPTKTALEVRATGT
ncbi:uncharacterized protein BCR38DRAFT_406913 [Pseudomassariella vexata]|uniref:PSI domain-containing protein n=1 Tax=Pseudomassariella vexata TaxID=1141098 RepID=A0A1Y2EBU6_9PEZI|nr:uncharacterized protein BCR38DRAFT_406913 [Pseudomassariella vexata]ORY69040.1 hypothetical protein BCR38DRAFT_406913 [Pseudomassariella vexata]